MSDCRLWGVTGPPSQLPCLDPCDDQPNHPVTIPRWSFDWQFWGKAPYNATFFSSTVPMCMAVWFHFAGYGVSFVPGLYVYLLLLPWDKRRQLISEKSNLNPNCSLHVSAPKLDRFVRPRREGILNHLVRTEISRPGLSREELSVGCGIAGSSWEWHKWKTNR